MSSNCILQKLPVLEEVVGDTVGEDGVGPERTVLVGNVGMLLSVSHGGTVGTELFSTVAGLDSRLARGGLWEGVRTCGIN